MNKHKTIAHDHNRMRFIAFLWVSSLQYYVVQAIVALNFKRGYNLSTNTISDLGNTFCGQYGERFVCSPDHVLMNLSFIVIGLTQAIGAFLLFKNNSQSMAVKLGCISMMIAGVGAVLVGIFPENSVSLLHIMGAALSFIFGNLGIISIGAFMKGLPRSLKTISLSLGVLGLASSVLLIHLSYLGLGIGGMERIAAYPQSVWMIVFGLWLLVSGRPTRQKR